MGGDRAGRATAVIGFCLAAGPRATPLTRVVPKPLLAPAGRPLVDLAVEALRPPARPGSWSTPTTAPTG